MLPIALALMAATSWGFSAVLVRKGLRDLSTQTGTLISLTAGLIVTAVLVVIFQFRELTSVTPMTVAAFAVIGILNFPMGRFFNYLAMGRLGVGRSTPLLASAPLFAVLLAIVVTHETIHLGTVAGIGLIVAGLYVTVMAPAVTAPAAIGDGSSARKGMLIGVGFALIAAMSYGTSQVLTRYVVSGAGVAVSPLVGSFIALFWGTLGVSVLSIRGLSQPAPNFRRGALYFAAGGIFSAGGIMLLFQALSRGTVVVVSPIAATNPLFTLFFAALLLRGVERITARIVVGAVLVVIGVVVLSVYR